MDHEDYREELAQCKRLTTTLKKSRSTSNIMAQLGGGSGGGGGGEPAHGQEMYTRSAGNIVSLLQRQQKFKK